MLSLPECNEPLRILSIDPGSYNTGVSKLELVVGEPIVKVESFTIKLTNTHPNYRGVREISDDQVGRLHQLTDELTSIIYDFQPHIVVAESNYMGRFADAFASLIACVTVIRNVLYKYDPMQQLYMVDPINGKKAAGVVDVKKKKGVSDEEYKARTRDALSKLTHLDWITPLDQLDEHSVDSVGIGLYIANYFTP